VRRERGSLRPLSIRRLWFRPRATGIGRRTGAFDAPRALLSVPNQQARPRSISMRIYVFTSDNDPDVLAFTLDKTGANLPSEYEWREAVEPGLVVIETER
jgi:hypothetical protein